MLRPATIWLTGLSGSGKTTLATGLHRRLAEEGIENVALLDGEAIRACLGRMYGHDIEDRYAVLKHIVDLAVKENRSERIAIVATISHRRDMRSYARRHIEAFMEVHVQCPVDVCAARDPKGHYRRAYAGGYECFAGVTEPYEPPLAPELTVDTAELDVEKARERLLQGALTFLRISPV